MNEQAVVDRFIRYVTCPSESRRERPFGELLEEDLKVLGMNPVRQDVGEACGSDGFNLYAMLPGEGEPVLFCAHMDTMEPGVGIKPIIDEGVIRSDGTTILGADDKSGIAATLEAIAEIKASQKPNRPVEVLFTICEEIGLLGAKYADYTMVQSKQAVVLDTGKMGCIINMQAAYMKLYVAIKGKSSHAGVAPELGIHALKAATDAIAKMRCGYLGENTVMNVANLLAPGKTNAVPDTATFEIEMRSHSQDELTFLAAQTKAQIEEACKIYGASFTVKEELASDFLKVPADHPLIVQLSGAMEQVGLKASVERTFGGCDATWLSANGISAINIGVGMRDAHSLDENIPVADLVKTAQLLELLMLAE
ncbi:MAG: M20/M25/M40 family metallo-hydrolase [Clostridiales bacterium]|nr:M20/M25/M40 family metallo-hydrolase [Clostridiales bacterium]